MRLRRRLAAVALLAAAVALIPAGAALAHKGKLPEDALTLVRQAAALLAQDPGMTREVRERLQAALKSRKPEGVHLERVAEALRALDRRDVAAARRLLAAAIMPAGMPMPPLGPDGSAALPAAQGRASPPPAAAVPVPLPVRPPAAPVGEQQAPPSVEAAMQMSESLRARFGGSTVEIVLLAAGVGIIGLGLFFLRPGREERGR